jgi:CheY-like chemotaxis protein
LALAEVSVSRWSIAEALRDAGYTVVETASGEEAIALCKSHVSNWPDQVTGDEMVAAMDKVGVDGAIFISAFSRISRLQHR